MVWLKTVLISMLAALAPAKAMLASAFVLVVLDTVTGVFAARKRGEQISSARLRRSIGKAFLYETVIVAAFLSEKYLLSDALPVTKIAAGAIGLAELLSVLENVNSATGKNIFGALLNKLGSPNDKPTQTKGDGP